MFPKTSSGRWLAGIVAAVALLAMLSIAVTLLAGNEAETLPEGSPERAVQDYLLAIQERDYATAYSLLSPELLENCTLQDFERSFAFRNESNMLVRLDEVRMTSTGAEVFVRITETFSAQPFPTENTFTQRYFLTQVDGAWKLSDAPWPFYGCYAERPFPEPTPTPTPTPTPAPTPMDEA